MRMDTNKKAWSQPVVTSVERLKHAASGAGTGLAKGPTTLEYDYNGPGS